MCVHTFNLVREIPTIVQTLAEGYKNVQDFSHIKASPSPNWSILESDSEERDGQWVLKESDSIVEAVDRICPGV